ncbi:hypothetical protein yfred0001_9650 [Yersinia frederiksenii ATCC 33641]|nr:hypothetical protein yfred0001_9650 [Yersinia frederiksenii ATCC 33641]
MLSIFRYEMPHCERMTSIYSDDSSNFNLWQKTTAPTLAP